MRISVLLGSLALAGSALPLLASPAAAYAAGQPDGLGVVTVQDDSGVVVARFTTGSRTVTIEGAQRTLTEAGLAEADAKDVVITTTYVRLLAAPFDGTFDAEAAWLDAARTTSEPDVLSTALQYATGAADVYAGAQRIAGDAHYGPVVNGVVQEGSDFNDYLGVDWTYGTETDPNESAQLGSLDCSGFTRMVFGYRAGVPLSLDPAPGKLPRRAIDMAASAPGKVVLPINESDVQVTSFTGLRPGDLVFFDGSDDDQGDGYKGIDGRDNKNDIDHVGVYLGTDLRGHHRFVSSRKTPDGPTMGDVGALSYLDGSYLYATAFRGARRL